MTASPGLSMSTGLKGHALSVRKDDCYETPDVGTLALLACERLPQTIWEPACGPGAITRILRGAGHQVIATDLVDYGLEDSASGVDFLMETKPAPGVTCIVTNPPFKLANEFVRHAVGLVDTTIMLLRLAYLEGAGRSDVIDRHLARVWLGRERLPMMHRYGWTGPKIGNSGAPFAWFVFTREPTDGVVQLRRTSWRESDLPSISGDAA